MTPVPHDERTTARVLDRAPGQFVECGGVRWHVRISGHGPVALLVHGTGASGDSFRALTPALAERFTVVVPDLPGHASSEVSPRFTPSLPATAAALTTLLATLDASPVVAVGHSAGAAVLARMTIDGSIDPRLWVGLAAALVPFHGVARAVLPPTARLLAAASKFVAPLAWRDDGVERLIRSTGSYLDRPGVERYGRLLRRPGHVTAVLSMMGNWDLDPLFADLPRLRTRALLLAGQGDRAVGVAQQRAVARRIADARLVVVEGVGHLLHEERPAAMARLILDEFDAVVRAGARDEGGDR